MTQTLLWICLLLQMQSSEIAVSPEAALLLKTGAEAESHRDIDGAISAYQKATDLAPSSSVAFLRLGSAYMKKGDYAAATPPLKKAFELTPDAPVANQLLGFALLAQGYAAEAIPHFEKAHEEGALGIAQLQIGQPAEAIAHLQAALAETPNDPDLLYYLSRAGTALASQSLDKLLSTFPDSARGHQAKGQNYYAMKKLPEAMSEYEQALALRPNVPGLRLELGQIYAEASEWTKAEEQFRIEAKLQPGNSEAAYRLGNALLQQGKMKEAAVELRRSDKLNPDMPETLYDLGKATTLSGPEEAEHAFARVVELEQRTPLAGRAYLALSAIHRKQGKLELAAKEMQQYRETEPANNSNSPDKP